LWFKETIRYGEGGTMIWSLDPQTMVSTLHSERSIHDSSGGDDCNRDHVIRKQAILALFCSAIPMMILSIALWVSKQISSMGIISYASLSLADFAIQTAINPEHFLEEGPPFRTWFAVSGLICLFISAHLVLSISSSTTSVTQQPLLMSKNQKEPLRALLITSAVAFTWGASMLFMFDSYDERDTLGRWILWNLLVFLPLLVLGAATDSQCLLVLGGLGFLADASRLASWGDSTLFFFVVFSLMGLAVGVAGYYFTVHYQLAVQNWSQAKAQLINNWVLHKYHQYGTTQDTTNLSAAADSIEGGALL